MNTPYTGAVQMSAESAPRFQVKLVHGPSGTVINTEAPRDNGGTGGSFSPTDLVGAALASCAMTTMALAASRESIPWGPTSARIEKRMTSAPRQIAELSLQINMPAASALPSVPTSRKLGENVRWPGAFTPR